MNKKRTFSLIVIGFLSFLFISCAMNFNFKTRHFPLYQLDTPKTLRKNEPPMPDLVVSALSVTGISVPFIYYDFTITNVGNAPANMTGVVLSAYRSADTIYGNAGDIYA